MILLDTHAWLWWAGHRDRLPAKLRRRLERERSLAVSAISAWEAARLVDRGRLRFRVEPRIAIRGALAVAGLEIMPVTDAIALEAGLLGGALHGDPADRIILATAIDLHAILVTKDERLQRSGLVDTLW